MHCNAMQCNAMQCQRPPKLKPKTNNVHNREDIMTNWWFYTYTVTYSFKVDAF